MKINKILGTFLILLLVGDLFASQTNLLSQYRTKGIYGIQKLLDRELTQTSYWKHYLQDKNTTFGYIESYDNILTCNKERSKLYVYRKEQNSSNFLLKREYNAYTGKNAGDKKNEGDLRTPVGIYELTQKIHKIDPFYGPLAFVTSYPNTYDKYQGKTGQGIWIHGLPIDQKRDEYTKGCIAIGNKNIECLDKNIDINKTILLINSNVVVKKTSKKHLANILSDLYSWRFAWIYNDIHTYLNFYAEDFKRFNGMNKEEFTRYKTRVFAKNETKTIRFNDINILPYPGNNPIYRITFYEYYQSDSFSFQGQKELIVRYINNKIQIVTEQ